MTVKWMQQELKMIPTAGLTFFYLKFRHVLDMFNAAVFAVCSLATLSIPEKGLVTAKMHWSALLKRSVAIETTLSCHSRHGRHGNGTYDSGPVVTSLQCHTSWCYVEASSVHISGMKGPLLEQLITWTHICWMQAYIRSGRFIFKAVKMTCLMEPSSSWLKKLFLEWVEVA